MNGKKQEDSRKVVLITGISRGMGYETARLLASKGFTVIGTSRNPEKISKENRIPGVSYLPLDITDDGSIQDLAKYAGNIDILINNAGSSQVGAIEDVPVENIRKYFEINVIGHIQVIKQFLPQMRQQRSGLIINISSMAGVTPVPFSSFYGAAKAAMRSMTQGLRHELKNFGIQVVDIAPFEVDTTIPQELFLSENSPYFKNAQHQKQRRDENLSKAVKPKEMAHFIHKIIHLKNPHAYYSIGHGAKLKTFLLKHLPHKVVENNMRKRYLMD
ncbi:SDR family oxidoreductase [Candidatus Lokiarchaeum ossiferum]|uniref:SDR family oxidoreductase n=1 Tax=Candidatus Lokiarchaeum ossiferum TaxID=2951803 RepID=UPI00352C7127